MRARAITTEVRSPVVAAGMMSSVGVGAGTEGGRQSRCRAVAVCVGVAREGR